MEIVKLVYINEDIKTVNNIELKINMYTCTFIFLE